MSDRVASGVPESNSLSNPLAKVLAEFAPIPSLVRKVSPDDRSYQMAQMLQEPAYLLMEQLLADLTIVYSPPKVGGQTITATLQRHPAIHPEPIHIHFLGPKGLAFMEWLIEQSQSHPNQHEWHTLMARTRWLRVLLAANRAVRAAGLPARKPFLVAGVREPISQYLSMVFQAWWTYADTPEGITADTVRARMANDPWRHQCNNWFADELGTVFGVDVFARPFPTDRGWDLYETDAARVLIIRQESLDRLPQSLGALFGFDPATVEVDTRNIGENKDYSAHYARVKKALRFSEEELDVAYAPAYVRHFYTPAEIATFRDRWRVRSDSAPQRTAEIPVAKSKPKPAPVPACEHPPAARREAAAHPWTCRPCPQCALQLQSIPTLQHACDERLALIQRLDAEVRRKSSLSGKLRSLLGRLLRRTPAA